MPKVPVVDLSPRPKAKTSSKKFVLGGSGTLNDMLNNAERKLRLGEVTGRVKPRPWKVCVPPVTFDKVIA
jgi:hypothetical protein